MPPPMTIILNHTIAPARDKLAAARFFAGIFRLDFSEQQSDHFAPVRVNETLTLLFDQGTSFDSHHYAFHVSDAERRYFRAHQENWTFIRQRSLEHRRHNAQ
jgi:hypothetical protein